MHPILVELGPLTLRWYGVCVALGFILAFLMFRRRSARVGIPDDEASTLILLLFVAGVLGARAWYVVRYWREEFAGDLREIVMIQHGGLVFFGGFVASLAVLAAWGRAKGRSLAVLADALAPCMALAHAFGRIGCFMNGCCHGRPSDAWWAIAPNSPPRVAGIPLHPTQLYEAVGLLDIMAALLFMQRAQRYPGQLAWSYILLYSLLRFVVEFFRGDVPHDALGRFTGAQVACSILFLVAWLASARAAYVAAKGRRAAARQAARPPSSSATPGA